MLYLVLVFGILPSLHNLLWLITILYLIPTYIFSHFFIWKVQVFKKAVGSINFLFVCGFENYEIIPLCLLVYCTFFMQYSISSFFMPYITSFSLRLSAAKGNMFTLQLRIACRTFRLAKCTAHEKGWSLFCLDNKCKGSFVFIYPRFSFCHFFFYWWLIFK